MSGDDGIDIFIAAFPCSETLLRICTYFVFFERFLSMNQYRLLSVRKKMEFVDITDPHSTFTLTKIFSFEMALERFSAMLRR